MAFWDMIRSRGALDERIQRGLDARARVPHDMHSELYRAQARPNPLALIRSADEHCIPELLPLRYERIGSYLHAYFRGSAAVMAADLSVTPTTDIAVQANGDADLLNFARLRTPTTDVFDMVESDQTLRAPWEWDVKRMATSMVVAARSVGAPLKDQRNLAKASVVGYRRGMAWASDQDRLRLWFTGIPASEVSRALDKPVKKRSELAESVSRTEMLGPVNTLTEVVDGSRRLTTDGEVLVPLTAWLSAEVSAEIHNAMPDLVASYATSLPLSAQELISEFRPVDVALRMTGVADVGIRSWVLLLQGAHVDEWMVLHIKQAGQSILQPYVNPEFRHRGNQARRIVQGTSVSQAAPDPLMGWARAGDRDYSVRHLWPVTASALTIPDEARIKYARLCGFALARAHAVTGDRVAINAYLGTDDSFAKSLARYAVRYADLVEDDYADFLKAAADGPLGLS